MNNDNDHKGPKMEGVNSEIVRVRPNSGEKNTENVAIDDSPNDSGNILSRKLPTSQNPTQAQMQTNPGQFGMGQPGFPGQFPGHPGQPGQFQGHPGQPQFRQQPQFMMQQQPNFPGGNQFMGRPQIPGQPGHPQQFGPGGQFIAQPQPQFIAPNNNAMVQNDMSRFQNDNKALQNYKENDGSGGAYGESQKCWGECTGWCGTWLPCLCCCPNPYKTVPEGFSGIIMRFGKFSKIVGPGMHYLIPDLDSLVLIDKREKVIELRKQGVVSNDNTTFYVDAVLYFRVTNTYKSKFGVQNLHMALHDLGITVLRNAVGRMSVQSFLEMRDQFADQIEAEIAAVAEGWGTKVTRVVVQDVLLPPEFRASFSTSAIAKRISEAQVIMSKAEVEVARLMKDAADALSTDAAFQIRYIDALENIANDHNPKMIFFPANYTDVGSANDDLMAGYSGRGNDENQGLLRKKH